MAIIDLLSVAPTFFITICVILGLIVGSFLNVVVYRLPIMKQRDWNQQCCDYLEIENTVPIPNDPIAEFEVFNLWKPDSYCLKCNQKIRVWENVPILSYIFLGGKCFKCKNPISPRYPLVEFANGLLSGLVGYTFGATWLTLAALILVWSLVVLALIDFDHQLLPDDITIPLLWLGLLVNTLDLGFGVSLTEAVLGAIGGYLVLWIFYWVFKLATGKEGMGYGDFKLLAALGAWLGWQSLFLIVILSSVTCAILGLTMIVTKGLDKSMPIPFGPFLAVSGLVVLIWGSQISSFYLRSFVG